MNTWGVGETEENPPTPRGWPAKLDYMTIFHTDLAYVAPKISQESMGYYRKRVYEVMLYYIQPSQTTPTMRIQTQWPLVNWDRVWSKFHEVPIPSHHTAVWYKVIHDVVKTNARLYRIRLSPTDRCGECGAEDALLHRFTECGESKLLWGWTAKIIAAILDTSASLIPQEWLLRPTCTIRPLTRKRAVLLILAQLIVYIQKRPVPTSLLDYMRHVRAARRHLQAWRPGREEMIALLRVVERPA
jgi:hypothetical protein